MVSHCEQLSWYFAIYSCEKEERKQKTHQLKTKQKSQILESTKMLRSKTQETESHENGLPLTEHNSKLDILNAVVSRHCECCG